MKIVIADDHPLLRQGVRKSIEAEPGFEIIGEAGDGRQALDLILELQPDIAVLDISMPELDGLEIVNTVQSRNLKTEFIILTMYREEEYFEEAMDRGVKGYLLKENAISDLINCIKSVRQGQYYVSPSISGYLINRNQRLKKLHDHVPSLDTLTPMERQVLKLVASNKTSKEIADELFISFRTVQNHRTNIANKLYLKGHNRLLQFAIENKALL